MQYHRPVCYQKILNTKSISSIAGSSTLSAQRCLAEWTVLAIFTYVGTFFSNSSAFENDLKGSFPSTRMNRVKRAANELKHWRILLKKSQKGLGRRKYNLCKLESIGDCSFIEMRTMLMSRMPVQTVDFGFGRWEPGQYASAP